MDNLRLLKRDGGQAIEPVGEFPKGFDQSGRGVLRRRSGGNVVGRSNWIRTTTRSSAAGVLPA